MSAAPNRKERVIALRAAAKALLVEQGVDVNEHVNTRPLVELFMKQQNCSVDAAKRHIYQAVRLARGEISQERWGGAREGAGRPKKEEEG